MQSRDLRSPFVISLSRLRCPGLEFESWEDGSRITGPESASANSGQRGTTCLPEGGDDNSPGWSLPQRTEPWVNVAHHRLRPLGTV